MYIIVITGKESEKFLLGPPHVLRPINTIIYVYNLYIRPGVTHRYSFYLYRVTAAL